MNGVLDWGVDVVLWFQQFSPALDLPFEAITNLGGLTAYLALLPLVYWCLDKPLGLRLCLFLPFSNYLNASLKAWFDTPRPFEYAPDRVAALSGSSEPGLPSGHAQTSTAMWGYVALWARRRWLWRLAAAMIFLVGLSRVYLGVHFPTDVLAGWAIGLCLVLLFWWLEPRLSAWLAERSLGFQMSLALGVPLAMLGLRPAEQEAKMVGVLLGISLGVIWERRWLNFAVDGTPREKVVRYGLGLASVGVIWVGFKLLFPGGDQLVHRLWDALRYGLVGGWAALGAPWLFVRLGLAQKSIRKTV